MDEDLLYGHDYRQEIKKQVAPLYQTEDFIIARLRVDYIINLELLVFHFFPPWNANVLGCANIVWRFDFDFKIKLVISSSISFQKHHSSSSKDQTSTTFFVTQTTSRSKSNLEIKFVVRKLFKGFWRHWSSRSNNKIWGPEGTLPMCFSFALSCNQSQDLKIAWGCVDYTLYHADLVLFPVVLWFIKTMFLIAQTAVCDLILISKSRGGFLSTSFLLFEKWVWGDETLSVNQFGSCIA